VLVFLALRLLTGVAALIMVTNAPMGKPNMLWYDPSSGAGNPGGETYEMSLPDSSPLAELVSPWRRYDTVWYANLAIKGYRANLGIVFPPLYPVLIHFTAPLLGNSIILAALLISNVFCLIAFMLLFRLIQREFNDDALATRTLILIAAFPTSFYLMAGYTEPLFLAFTLGALLAAFDQRWWMAGALSFLAALTRLQGLVLCLPLGWIAYVQTRDYFTRYRSDHDRGALLRSLAARLPAALGAGAGTLVYMAYLAINNFGSLEAAYNWGWKLTTRMPWVAVQTYFDRIGAGIVPEHENNNALVLVAMIVLGILVTIKFRPVYSLYVWSTLLAILLRYHYGELLEGAQFESAFRYVLLLFPCFIAAALLIKRRWMLLAYSLVGLQWGLYLLDHYTHWIWVA